MPTNDPHPLNSDPYLYTSKDSSNTHTEKQNAPSHTLRFEVIHQSTKSSARLGRLHTPHGTIDTPAFIFCATNASLKGLSTEVLRSLGIQIILSNTYHLMLQPGADLVADMGGLHTFMNWQGPMLTDSGGFQIFSLGHGGVACEIKGKGQQRPKQTLEITEEGALFKSYLNGDRILLTPEKSMEIQQKLGADLIVSFDECTPYHVPRSYTEASMYQSIRWGKRCLKAFHENAEKNLIQPPTSPQTTPKPQGLYGVIQGGTFPDLRKISCAFVNEHPFFGHAIGGSLGHTWCEMNEVVHVTAENLSPDRPIHLLGIGQLRDINTFVAYGIDTFDCVHPTRIARHGGALVKSGSDTRAHINLKNAHFAKDPDPIDPECLCPTCKNYSKAYLHHLFKAKEMLGPTAVTLHNVAFMERFMQNIRTRIRGNTL